MPCNMAKAPKCQCSGTGSSILKDRTGTWCTRYANGEELTRKLALLCVLSAVVVASEVTNESDCKCWEDFKPEKGATGSYYCRGEKNHRIFGCGEDKPPICKCEVEGKIIEQDLGETNCLSVNSKDGRWCHNKEEFQEYFRKHPEHAIYD
ncbi:hypothetical protein MTP99_000311 [Tenebrio molitor]|nr:hypothetical protein MTP99_000311 [Tenebrio molitor]